jgi:hypothetical protein
MVHALMVGGLNCPKINLTLGAGYVYIQQLFFELMFL